jgi:hypothetical protein
MRENKKPNVSTFLTFGGTSGEPPHQDVGKGPSPLPARTPRTAAGFHSENL